MVTRRQILRKVAYFVGAIPLWPIIATAESFSKDKKSRQFRWRVPSVHFETVKKELTFEGTVEKEQDSKGVFVFIFIGAVLIPYLARAVLALHREIVHGGIIIDTRGEKIDIDTDKSLPGGVIVLRTPEGTQLIERNDISDPAELVGALMKGL